MNIGTIIIGAIFLAICILPFALISMSKKKKEKQLLKKLNEIAQQSDSHISQYERCNDMIIGIDKSSNHFFAYKNLLDRESEFTVNLKEIQQCRIMTNGKVPGGKGNGESNFRVVDRLSLLFNPGDKEKTSLQFELFNHDDNQQMDGELELARKWEKILNDQILSAKK
jgi:hypothetical protein